MLLKKCDQYLEDIFNPELDPSGPFVINSIVVDGITYTSTPPLNIGDVPGVNAFFNNSGITKINYTYDILTGTYRFQVTKSIRNFQYVDFISGYGTPAPAGVQKSFSEKTECQWLPPDASDGVPIPVRGCTDPYASNYNSDATEDNGSCVYLPQSDLQKIECCIGEALSDFADKMRRNCLPTNKVSCVTKDLYFRSMGLEYLKWYQYEGTIIRDAVVPLPEILATAIKIFDFLNTSGYTNVTITINGITIATLSAEFYYNIGSLVAALYAYAVANPTVYGVSKSSITMTFTAPVGSGISGNLFPVIITGTQIHFDVINTIASAGITCAFGCYDPDRNEIIFASDSQHAVVIYSGSVLVGTLDVTDPGGEAIYNPNTFRKYIGCTTGKVAVIGIVGSINVEIPPKLTTDGTGTYFCCYNAFLKRMYFSNTLGTDASATLTGSVSVFDGNVLPEVKLADVPLAQNFFPRGVTFHPITGNTYVVGDGDLSGGGFPSRFSVIDAANAIVATGNITIAHPVYPLIVLNATAGIYELWICGSMGNIEIFNASTLAQIEVINIGAPYGLLCIKQHSNGYVWATSNSAAGGFVVIRVDDRVLIKPMQSIPASLWGLVEDMSTGDMYAAAPSWTIGQPPAVLQIKEFDDAINESVPMTGGQSAVTDSAPAVVITAQDNCGETEAEYSEMLTDMAEGCTPCCDPNPYVPDEVATDPDNPPVGPCDLTSVDVGLIHCTGDYIACVDATGNMAYLDYYYVYEWSIDNVTWTPFGANTSEQQTSVGLIPDPGGAFLRFRVTVKCTIESVEFRQFFLDQTSYLPFYNFIYVIVNGVKKSLIRSIDGINYFGSLDVVEFVQPNTNFTTNVIGPSGPTSWAGNYKLFNPGELADGLYQAAFTDISGGIFDGCSGGNGKEFEIQIMPAPVISGPSEMCFEATSPGNLDPGLGYDSYAWYKDGVATGQTTQSIPMDNTTAGVYTVVVEDYDYPGLFLTSAPFTFSVWDPVPALTVGIKPGTGACVQTLGPNSYQMNGGNQFTLLAADLGIGYTYDFGAGASPDREFAVNGGVVLSVVPYNVHGCPGTPVEITVAIVDSALEATLQELAPSPNLQVRVTITDTRVVLPPSGLIIDVYNEGAGSPVNYTDQMTFDHTANPGDTFITLIGSYTDPTTGCNIPLLVPSFP